LKCIEHIEVGTDEVRKQL